MVMPVDSGELSSLPLPRHEFGSYLENGFIFRLETNREIFENGNQKVAYTQMTTPAHFGRIWETRTSGGKLVQREGNVAPKEYIINLMEYASSVLKDPADQQLTSQNKSILFDVITYGYTVLEKHVADEKRYLDNVVERAGEIVARHEEQFLDD